MTNCNLKSKILIKHTLTNGERRGKGRRRETRGTGRGKGKEKGDKKEGDKGGVEGRGDTFIIHLIEMATFV